MIDAKELRIGNWIRDPQYGTVQVLWIMEDRHDGYWGPVIKHTGYHSQRAISTFAPSPLTPEILEKCGFVFNTYWETEIVDLSEDKDGFFLCTEDCNEGDIYRLSRGFHFLHQLQNLFYCLTGQELEIKL